MPGYERTPFFSFQTIFTEQPALAAFVTTDTAQSVANSTLTNLAFTTPLLTDRLNLEAYRTLWQSATPGQFTVTVRGVYLIGAAVSWAAAPTLGTLQLIVNGTPIARQDITAPAAHQTVTTCYPLVAGDVVIAQAFQTSGGALNTALYGESPNFWIVRIG